MALSSLDYFIFILFLLKLGSSIEMCVKYWIFEIMTKLHVDKEDRIFILNMYTKFQTRISRSINIQIRPTFDLYCRLHNSFNFEQKLMFEWARFKTYESAPETLRASRLKLAKAGFFYTGVGHKCKCAFCGFSYDVSSETGDPDDVHRRLNPNCPFLVDRVNTNNIAIDADERALFQRRSPAFLTSSSRNFQSPAVFAGGHVSRFQTGGYAFDFDSTEQIDSYVRLVIQGSPPNEERPIQNISERENQQREGPINYTKTNSSVSEESETPKYPKYAIRSSRIDSFANWPVHLTQSPADMASAGFFYTGTSDHCRCFFCGGGLRNWEPVDQPWEEHAHWYPECPFVRQCAGDDSDFKDIQRNRNLLIAPTEETNQNPDVIIDPINFATTNNGFSSHQAVKSVLELGFKKGLVKKAYDLLQLAGRIEITANVLMEAVFQIEKNETENGYATSGDTCSSVDNFKQQFQETSITSLKEENQNLRDQQTCKICLEEPVSILFLPCGHLASCVNCASMLRRCPICRKFIKGTVKTYLS
ncbi:baculoviral IAP repeat-containing protein 7-like [Mytilus edulis]|uniref:baculoviral IAP repeat-containing protein 7-like n=1 Tax=Mytilus edulis TaxID=6550 RepID=UPI0039F0E2EE